MWEMQRARNELGGGVGAVEERKKSKIMQLQKRGTLAAEAEECLQFIFQQSLLITH